MLTFFQILKIYDIDHLSIKLVRHGNAQIQILDTFRNNRDKFEVYQSFQTPNKFSTAQQIAVFAPYRNTLALFLGLWNIKDYVETKNYSKKIYNLIDKYSFPDDWYINTSWYNLEYNSILEDLSERLVIDWGKSTLSWVQKKDKEIVELKSKNSIGDFISFDRINLSFTELQQLRLNQQSNSEWVNVLSNTNGIYLIRDKKSNKMYVGSAYGENGLFGRWMQYAKSGHGGNKELKKVNPENFEFSILELIPSTISNDEVIRKENNWKIKLATRECGLNIN